MDRVSQQAILLQLRNASRNLGELGRSDFEVKGAFNDLEDSKHQTILSQTTSYLHQAIQSLNRSNLLSDGPVPKNKEEEESLRKEVSVKTSMQREMNLLRFFYAHLNLSVDTLNEIALGMTDERSLEVGSNIKAMIVDDAAPIFQEEQGESASKEVLLSHKR